MPAMSVERQQDYSYQLNAAYNISRTIFHESMYQPALYTRSLANFMCPTLLLLNTGKCLTERGKYYKSNYYVCPISKYDKNIHNVLFRNSFPHLKENITVNN